MYDGDGARVKATQGGVTTAYVGNHYELEGTTTRKYYYAGGARVAMRENSTLYWLFGDHLGSTAITAYSGGGKKAELRYRAFGETRYTWGTTPTDYHFTGQREDVTIGLYFYNARYYDPSLARFIQADTIVPNPGNPQDFNRYSYVRNNPLVYIDPSGHPCIVLNGETHCSDEIPEAGPNWNDLTPGQQELAGAAYLHFLDDPAFFLDLFLHDRQNVELVALNSWAQYRENRYVATLLGADAAVLPEQIEEAARLATSGDIDAREFLSRVWPVAIVSLAENGGNVANAASSALKHIQREIHGNSLASPKPTWLYKLVDRATGQVMKYGITNETNPQWRYSKQYYQQNNVRLEPIVLGQRWHMYQLEYQLNVQNDSPWSKHGH